MANHTSNLAWKHFGGTSDFTWNVFASFKEKLFKNLDRHGFWICDNLYAWDIKIKKNTVIFDEALVLFPPAVSWKETDWSVTSSLVVYDVLNLVILRGICSRECKGNFFISPYFIRIFILNTWGSQVWN